MNPNNTGELTINMEQDFHSNLMEQEFHSNLYDNSAFGLASRN